MPTASAFSAAAAAAAAAAAQTAAHNSVASVPSGSADITSYPAGIRLDVQKHVPARL